jgi:fatty acid desaturase
VVFNVALLTLCILAGRWYFYFLLWLYPIVAVAVALNIIRTIAEHQPEDFARAAENDMQPVVRTTVPNWFEKWLMYQANFNYHVEHHLFPTIPHHNLGLVHCHLRDRGFYQEFPGCLQNSGLRKFVLLSQNRVRNDFSDTVTDALSL